MGACVYTTDPEKNCNGIHNAVKAVETDTIAKLQANGHPDAAESLKLKQSLGRAVITLVSSQMMDVGVNL